MSPRAHTVADTLKEQRGSVPDWGCDGPRIFISLAQSFSLFAFNFLSWPVPEVIPFFFRYMDLKGPTGDPKDDDPDHKSDGLNPVAAAFTRALIRLRNALRVPRRLPVRTVAKAADRVSTFVDVSEALAARGGLRAVLGGGLRAVASTGTSVFVSLGKATITGTILFSVFESSLSHGSGLLSEDLARAPPMAAALPATAGAIAGSAYGSSVVILDHLPLKDFKALRSGDLARELWRAARGNAVEWGGAFGVYFIIRQSFLGRELLTEAGDASSSPVTSEGFAVQLSRLGLLAAAAIGGGAAQVSAASLASLGRNSSWGSTRAALTPWSVGTAALGLAAYELGHYLD
jgi:hypothetical protein